MLKTTLYSAATAGVLLAAAAMIPANAVPVAPAAPQVEKNTIDAQHRHWRRHHRHHYYDDGYYYRPAPGIYFYGPAPRHYHW